MEFKLETVVPWGKNLDEYRRMFDLSEVDLGKRIASFADGTSSFNAEMWKNNSKVTSLDPIYQYKRNELLDWADTVLKKAPTESIGRGLNTESDSARLEKIRIQTISNFIDDFEIGKIQSRYVYHMFPNKAAYEDQYFDLGLCANFLLLYSHLGLEFHKSSIEEMLRLCSEVRIFPIVDFRGMKLNILKDILNYFATGYVVEIVKVNYGFQGMGYEMLCIRRR